VELSGAVLQGASSRRAAGSTFSDRSYQKSVPIIALTEVVAWIYAPPVANRATAAISMSPVVAQPSQRASGPLSRTGFDGERG